jgi:fructose-bisphosphate aldolase class II
MLELRTVIDALAARFSRSAIAAFNINDMTDMHGVMQAAMKMGRPLIMNTSVSAMRYFGINFVREMYKAAVMTSPVPLYLMLDHSETVEDCLECAQNGYSIVMFDGSALSFEQNARKTREVVKAAHKMGVLVEGEIGRLPGREETLSVAHTSAFLTKPEEAREFAETTGVDLLAISFGTAHGFYKSKPCLNFGVIERTHALTSVPLVMHGGTGVPDEDVRRAISLGVKKVNIGTEVKNAYTMAMREHVTALPKELDPRKILIHAKKAVQRVAEEKVALAETPRAEEFQ